MKASQVPWRKQGMQSGPLLPHTLIYSLKTNSLHNLTSAHGISLMPSYPRGTWYPGVWHRLFTRCLEVPAPWGSPSPVPTPIPSQPQGPGGWVSKGTSGVGSQGCLQGEEASLARRRRRLWQETQNCLHNQRGQPRAALNQWPTTPPLSRPKSSGCWRLAMGEASWEEANRKTNITWELWTSFQTESPQISLFYPLTKKRPSHEKKWRTLRFQDGRAKSASGIL